ncbi:hypothetical protein ElyMa_002953200 [Elysia marginata]|uniref:Uncharacterized protein n=1 Tax=Elysia marginata TaxID=1093978 RepID=A0AAV4IBG1_9GAST|nr:hypothetical protein ElyMa_002953200 [Elysia marginata]
MYCRITFTAWHHLTLYKARENCCRNKTRFGARATQQRSHKLQTEAPPARLALPASPRPARHFYPTASRISPSLASLPAAPRPYREIATSPTVTGITPVPVSPPTTLRPSERLPATVRPSNSRQTACRRSRVQQTSPDPVRLSSCAATPHEAPASSQ